MELIVKRTTFTPKSTIGELWVDGQFFCYTLEDTRRGLKQSDSVEDIRRKKLPGITAIPSGRYQLILNYSNRFKKIMPLLLNVPGFEGVRIHAGNKAEDTEGCLLLGMEKAVDSVLKSRAAFQKLMSLLQNDRLRKEYIKVD